MNNIMFGKKMDDMLGFKKGETEDDVIFEEDFAPGELDAITTKEDAMNRIKQELDAETTDSRLVHADRVHQLMLKFDLTEVQVNTMMGRVYLKSDNSTPDDPRPLDRPYKKDTTIFHVEV